MSLYTEFVSLTLGTVVAGSRESLAVSIQGVNSTLGTALQGIQTSVLTSTPTKVAMVGGGIKGDPGTQGIQGPIGSMPTGNLQDVVYDNLDRVAAYTLDGIPFTIAYPNPFTVVRTGNGKVRTATLDLLGRIVAVQTA